MSARFAGKVILITGAGSGIGQCTALAFATEGGHVVVADRSLEAANRTVGLIREAGGKALGVACDVTRADDCAATVAKASELTGRIDVLINNAGIGHSGSILGTDEATWNAVMNVNVNGTFLMSKATLPTFIKQGSGAIVNTASIAGIKGLPDRAVYCTSKFAVVGLTRAMALDHVLQGVRINCVCPGTTDTPWIAERLGQAVDPESARAALVARQPMGRLGLPQEIAKSILFLASDESSFTTGTALSVDGGYLA